MTETDFHEMFYKSIWKSRSLCPVNADSEDCVYICICMFHFWNQLMDMNDISHTELW